MKDIDIARQIQLKSINDIAKKINISNKYLVNYGNFKAKIDNKIFDEFKDKEDGKLILVTSINPTPLGEGKTTISIGLADGLAKINKKVCLALREPSLGPVFGIKGGATGGGYAQVAPMEDINLHFTGDIHAITTANNLLCAMIDNHINFGNSLDFKTVTYKRCMDMNDRVLRKIEIGLSEGKEELIREDGFDISVASEIMAIFCLAKDIFDLKIRIGNIIVGYNSKDKPIYAKDLKAEGAMAVLLKDALNPNLVQTLEGNPAIIHGGPFANIAHGCNSVIATNMALKLADYVVTEAGFGADLGAEKFLNIKCHLNDLKPNAVIIVATIKALKYHGGMAKDDLINEDLNYLEKGIDNLLKHIDNIKNKFKTNVCVTINRFTQDTEKEIEFLKNKLETININLSVSEVWAKGGAGAIDLANEVVRLCELPSNLEFIYDLDDDIKTKIEKVTKEIYGAKDVEIADNALAKIKQIEDLGYNSLPICIAKTQYSLSDDPSNLLCEEEFNITVKDILLKSGAGFIVIITGKIMTMPGLSKIPSAESIDIDENGEIVGIF